jgi:ATP-binding cassette subfamily B protein
MLGFSRPYLRDILLVLLVTVLMTLSSLATPYMSKLFIDYVFKMDPGTGEFLYPQWHLVCVGIMFGAYLLQSVFSALHERIAGIVGFKTIYDVRAALYRKIQEVSLAFFDKRHTGYILARINQDTAELQRLLVDFIPMTADMLLTLVGVGALLFVISWRLTLFVFIPILATVLFMRFIFPIVRAYFHRYFHRRSRLTTLVSDSVSGIRVVKAFGQEDLELDKFDTTSRSYRDSGIELVRRWSIFHPAMHLFIMSGAVLVWLVGGRLILRGAGAPGGMSVGDVVAYSGYVMMFYRPVFMLTRMSDYITNALAAGERVLDILDVKSDIQDDPEAQAIETLRGDIELKDVEFGYVAHESVIKGISLSIHANEMIGLVGKSGVGKSTIINLISRLYDVSKGSIRIDGIDLRNIRQADLRANIGVVLQETFLFSGTILENISYARPDATKEEIIDAAIAAHAHDFIVTKPDGYDTIVGERGSRLSGGEKQRISIARAVLRDPRILILDEATSSVDVQTEGKIQKALENLTRGRTTIAIAHRLATLRNCDRLVVIEDGKILESGTHTELMQKKGAFYELAKSQEQLSAIVALEG